MGIVSWNSGLRAHFFSVCAVNEGVAQDVFEAGGALAEGNKPSSNALARGDLARVDGMTPSSPSCAFSRYAMFHAFGISQRSVFVRTDTPADELPRGERRSSAAYVRARPWIFALLALAPGCAAYTDETSDDVMEAEVALVELNQLTSNALALNGLALAGLALDGIALDTLDPSALATLRDPGPNGTLARSFVKYAVGCAFGTWQSFSFTWTDTSGVAHNEVYKGEMGIAPGWSTGPLDLRGQYMVSACVAARVNYYQVPVSISLRSPTEPLKSLTGSQELLAYPNVEGAFWGNLWAPTPFLHACYNSATVANSRAWKRDCAAGHLNADGTVSDCGMIDIVGPCSTACQNLSSTGQYYPSCTERPGQTSATTEFVITTALP